jgi:hypothetical protein
VTGQGGAAKVVCGLSGVKGGDSEPGPALNLNVEPPPTWLFTQISAMERDNFRRRIRPSPCPPAGRTHADLTKLLPPPSWVNLIAFDRRLSTTCLIFRSSVVNECCPFGLDSVEQSVRIAAVCDPIRTGK